MTDGAIDQTKMEDSLRSHLGDFFQAISNQNAAITAKIFGGQPRQKVNIMDFVTSIDKWYAQFKNVQDYTALMFLFQRGWYLDEAKTDQYIKPMFDAGFKLMNIGLIGYLFNARHFYVMHFSKMDQKTCNSKFQGASRFLDGGCFVLKEGGKCMMSGDNAGTELKKAESKYNMNVANFFRNVRDCNNNKDEIDHKAYTMAKIGDMGKCFFPLNYLTTDIVDNLYKINHTIADQLGLKYPKVPKPFNSWC
ncbi:hypothetical protein F5Y05DRAFT_377814 [Hypoxylon sp. FL0543]|nr:hypothetical protein F5Y05DRAFT_377814 [Hypoxylon sp. FL0543]